LGFPNDLCGADIRVSQCMQTNLEISLNLVCIRTCST